MRGQHGFLMDHRNPLGCGLGWVFKADGAALPKHFAAVGLEHARHDLHQRGLAGAVFAHQQVHFSGLDVEIPVAQGRNPSEMLLDGF